MTKGNEKTHDTALRMLELLKLLHKKTLSRKELLNTMQSNGVAQRIYTPEVLLKYLNTFNAAGLNIEKIKTKYNLKNGFYELVLSREEEDALEKLITNCAKFHDRKEIMRLKTIIFELDKFTHTDIYNKFSRIPEDEELNKRFGMKQGIISTLEKYISDNQSVKIKYIKANKEFEAEVRIKSVNKEKSFVICYLPKETKNIKIRLDSITKMEQSPNKIAASDYLKPVIFELYGRLSSLYKLKKGETTVDTEPGKITVSNKDEDKDSLLRRLLKYGRSCKVIKPTGFRDEFIALSNQILKNIESTM